MKPWTLLCGVGLAALGPADLPREEFEKLHAELTKSEPWETIPWQSNLVEAKALALKERKPLFIWAMDGKPLGSV